MSAGERQALMRMNARRAKLSTLKAKERVKILFDAAERSYRAQYKRRDELWADVVAAAERQVKEANDEVRRRCAEVGIPTEEAPKLRSYWTSPSDYYSKDHLAAMRKQAKARLDAMLAVALRTIEEHSLAYDEALLLGSLTSNEARALAEAMPTVEQLMPALSLEDLGVKTWQPPPDAVAKLTAPDDPIERRRRQIRHAIESNPAASDRQLGQQLGIDHKTVGKYRRELPGNGGEIPTHSPADGDPR
jgi:hypothetical protein